MKTFRFRTAIKEYNDIEKIKIHLNGVAGIKECFCENNDPERALIIKAENVPADLISREIFNAGYRNEIIKSGWKAAAKKLLKKDCCK